MQAVAVVSATAVEAGGHKSEKVSHHSYVGDSILLCNRARCRLFIYYRSFIQIEVHMSRARLPSLSACFSDELEGALEGDVAIFDVGVVVRGGEARLGDECGIARIRHQ